MACGAKGKAGLSWAPHPLPSTQHPRSTQQHPACAQQHTWAKPGVFTAAPAASLSTLPPTVDAASEAVLEAAEPSAVAATSLVRVSAVAAWPAGAEAWAVVKPPVAAAVGLAKALMACRHADNQVSKGGTRSLQGPPS